MADKWIQQAKEKGTIRSGTFTAKAKKAGKSVAAYAEEKAGAPGVLGKEARLAKTFAKIRRHNSHMAHVAHP